MKHAQLTETRDRRRDRSHERRGRREIPRCGVIPLLLRGLWFVCHPMCLGTKFRFARFRILLCAEGDSQRPVNVTSAHSAACMCRGDARYAVALMPVPL